MLRTVSGYKGYKVTASNDIDNNSNLDKFRAFNGITGNEAWGSGGSQFTSGTGVAIVGGDSLGNVEGQWLKLQLPLKIKLSHIKLTSRDITGIEYPKDFQILGSNDDSNWTQLINVVDAPYTQHLTLTHHVTGTVDSFQYLAVVVTKTYGGTGVTISELEYYGHEEGSGSLDTTIKSVYNVPATTGTQLEVYYDGRDYTGVTSTVNDKVGTATNATITNTNNEITFDSTYKAWTFGGTDTRTSNFQSSALPSTFSDDQVHSVTLWFKCDIVSGDTLFSITQPSDPWEDDEKVISVRLSDESGGLRYLFWSNDIRYDGTEANITKDIWYHLCVTYSGGGGTTDNKKLYLNGNEIHHTSTSGSDFGNNLSLPSGSVIRLGSRVQETTRFFGSIANFRLYSKALNAGQVQELYDYQKDYFFGTHSSVTLHKGRFGVGTKEPMKELDVVGDVGISANLHMTTQSSILVDSNVVTEYTGPHDRPLRKYPEVALTADSETASGYKGYKVTASVDNTNTFLNKWRIFNGLTGNEGWVTDGSLYDSSNDFEYISSGTSTLGGVSGEWVKLELPTKIRLSRIVMTARDLTAEQHPEDFQILGSNDDSNWTQVMNVVGAPFTQGSTLTFNVTGNVEHFRYLAVIVTRTVGHSAAAISELEYYGHEEGSGSLDTTLKTVYNVPATTGTQLEVYYDAKDLDNGAVTSVTDLSPNTNNGTLSGDPQISNGAFVFDGSGDAIVSSGTSTSLDGNATFSISLWSKTNTVSSGSNALFMLGYSSANKSTGLRIDASTGKYRFFTTGGLSSKTSPTTALLNEWTHITLIHEGTSGYKFYVNGVFIDEITVDNDLSLDSNPRVALGNYIDAAGVVTGTASYDGSIANFRLYSKALNADQVKELYDYQKDYFLGSKSQVTLYKGHLGVGVTEPSGQLELAGDERIQEYPPGPMDGYETHIPGHGVFCAYASSFYTSTNYFAWYAFDKTDAKFWVSDDTDTPETYDQTTGLYTGTRRLSEETVLGEYIILKLPYSINLKSFTMGVRPTELLRGPKSGIVYGRKNNNWEVVHSFSGVTYTTSERQNIRVTNPNEYYNEFALVTTALAPNGSTYHNINLTELRYFGTPGPTTLDKGSLTLGRSLDVPRISRYDVDTETPRPEKLVLDFDTTVNSSPTDISGKGNHGVMLSGASYSAADKAFDFNATSSTADADGPSGSDPWGSIETTVPQLSGAQEITFSGWFKLDAIGVFQILYLLGRVTRKPR